jgi:hypothetical protein
MSSNHSSPPIGHTDISAMRDAIRRAGFQYEEPMGDLDRGDVRHVIDLYQHTTHKPEELIAGINSWAEHAITLHARPARSEVVL